MIAKKTKKTNTRKRTTRNKKLYKRKVKKNTKVRGALPLGKMIANLGSFVVIAPLLSFFIFALFFNGCDVRQSENEKYFSEQYKKNSECSKYLTFDNAKGYAECTKQKTIFETSSIKGGN